MSNNKKQDELVPKVQTMNNDRLTASVSQLIIPRVLSVYRQTNSIDKLTNYYTHRHRHIHISVLCKKTHSITTIECKTPSIYSTHTHELHSLHLAGNWSLNYTGSSSLSLGPVPTWPELAHTVSQANSTTQLDSAWVTASSAHSSCDCSTWQWSGGNFTDLFSVRKLEPLRYRMALLMWS